MRSKFLVAPVSVLAAICAMPATAQLLGGGGVGAGVGATVGATVDTGRVLDRTVSTADRIATRAVDRTDRLASRTINGSRVSIATSAQVTSGTTVRDSRGQRVGTVSRVEGDSAIVVSGSNMYHVPLSQLYAYTSGTAKGLVTAVPRASLTGHANAQASARSSVN